MMIWASLQASSQSCSFAIVLECNKVENLEIVMYKSLWLNAVWCLVLLLLRSKADLALVDEVQY